MYLRVTVGQIEHRDDTLVITWICMACGTSQPAIATPAQQWTDGKQWVSGLAIDCLECTRAGAVQSRVTDSVREFRVAQTT